MAGGIILSFICVNASKQPSEVGTVTPNLQMRKWNYKHIKKRVQGHRAVQVAELDSNPSGLAPESKPLNLTATARDEMLREKS